MLTVDPKDVKWVDGPDILPKGAKIAILQGELKQGYFVFRLKLPDGYKFPAHYHVTQENVTVIKGTLYLGMQDKFDAKTMMALPAGGYCSIPARHHHASYVKGETIFQVNSVGPWEIHYINPADDPRNAPKK